MATIRNGRRVSAADAFLHPAEGRPNLTVEVDALVTRILFDGDRAIGVQVRRGNDVAEYRAALAASLRSLGRLNHLTGRDGEAERTLEQSVATARELAAAHRGVADYQRDVADHRLIRPALAGAQPGVLLGVAEDHPGLMLGRPEDDRVTLGVVAQRGLSAAGGTVGAVAHDVVLEGGRRGSAGGTKG